MNIAEKVKTINNLYNYNISVKKWFVCLFRAAPYKLIFVLDKDLVFHFKH
jgi:hypothetical protein